jgi:hypothetical protein
MSDYPRDAQDAVELEASKRAAQTASRPPMTDTRYSAEELREWAQESASNDKPVTSAMLNQAARDSETLAGIRAWLVKSQSEPCACLECASYRNALAELDRLSRGDA